MIKHSTQTQKGFTLVEMIVSLAIFTIVALVAVGALIKVMDANRKSISMKTSINNLNFALESMSREMRMGKNYSCSTVSLPTFDSENNVNRSNCETAPTDTSWYIAFNSPKEDPTKSCNLVYMYKYTGSTILKAEQSSCSEVLNDISSFFPLIAVDITISSSSVVIDNSNQPRMFLYVSGSSGVKAKDKTEFSIQTTISQRLPKTND